MKKILVPSDFSPAAQQAYTFALDLAKKTNAEIYVVHAFFTPFMYDAYSVAPPTWLTPEIWQRFEEEAREKFNKMKSAHSRQNDITFRVIEGPTTQVILDFIDKEDIDMVVMGTHGSSGFDEYVFGSTTEKIVRFSKVPVFAIRKAVNIGSIDNIVFPTNGALDQDKFIVRLKELQKMFDAKLHILYVTTPYHTRGNREMRIKLEDLAKRYDLKNYSVNIRTEFTEEAGIIDFTDEINADIVAMPTHGRRGLAHLFVGSIAENTLNHISCPIWTYTLRKEGR